MYAVIKTGGKQYRVQEGDVIKFESLPIEIGHEVNFSEVLLIADDSQTICGTPFVENSIVTGEVVEHGRHKKVKIIKFRRRKHHMKQMGHRQNYTQVLIKQVTHN